MYLYNRQYEKFVWVFSPKYQASVESQRKKVEMNEQRTANGHCCLLIHSLISDSCLVRSGVHKKAVEIDRWGLNVSFHGEEKRFGVERRCGTAEPPEPLDPEPVHCSIHH